MGPFESIKTYPINGPNITGVMNGYIVSPGYPEFAFGVSNVLFGFAPPAGYEYRVYVVDIAMSLE